MYVDYHFELGDAVKANEPVKGGGLWKLDGKSLYLWGESTDYNQCSLKNVATAVNLTLVSPMIEKFFYSDSKHKEMMPKETFIEIPLLSDKEFTQMSDEEKIEAIVKRLK